MSSDSFFMFSNFYRLDSHNKTRVALEIFAKKHLQKPDGKPDLPPSVSYGYQKCMLWIS